MQSTSWSCGRRRYVYAGTYVYEPHFSPNALFIILPLASTMILDIINDNKVDARDETSEEAEE